MSVRAAVIGTGFIGTVHVESLRRLGVEVAGVLGSSPERGRERAQALRTTAYESLDALLADASVDAVHVTTPNVLHHEQVRAILAAGKHVVCEKPLAMDAAEARDLLDAARAAGVVHATNFHLRYYPLARHVAELRERGELGEVRLVTGHYLQDWLLHETDWNWRVEAAVGGSLRAVGDIGCHWLDLACALTGERVAAVMADLPTFVAQRLRPRGSVETFAHDATTDAEPVDVDTEDAATILVRFDGGAHGCVAVSQVSPGHKNALQICVDGSRSAARWASERPDELWIGHRDRSNELLQRDPALLGAAGRAATRLPGGHVEGFADAFVSLHAAIYEEIERGGPSEAPAYPTFAAGHDAMLVADAIARSARMGAWAAVDSSVEATP